MIELVEFAKNFNGKPIPTELSKLLKFQNKVSKNSFFSNGFELIVDTEKFGLKTYSNDETFLSSIIEFAKADYTGSTYGVWIVNQDKNLSEFPIVVFGSEGGFHVVAENIRELLQLLTFDEEPMIDWDKVSFYKDTETHEPSPYSREFRNWLKNTFNLEPVENPNLIVKKAQEKYQANFQKWFESYYTE